MSRAIWIAALGALALAGCGGELDELGLVTVTGKITLDDKPVSGARVSFEGDDKRSAQGVTDSGGNYSLMYDSETAGVTPGRKTVRITLSNAEGEADPDAPTTGEGAVKEPIPARYNRKSELTADVSAANRTFDFKLFSKP